ncbi:site-specific DNA-methyltransferase [Ileibacterium valens]|uniref:site-specific DNA-methyltransferase n=1 Tax=Ileibacterium valens TaxID=1862668 RepID=UPI00272C5BFB|nr:site-specific DNA-methyltransferase [Ileibacterium valens]
MDPLIWNEKTGTVVGGHQRLKVLQDLGVKEVECVIVDFDLEKEKALNVALNKISGDWDKEKLGLLITDLQGEDFDVSLTGFDPAEIDDLFKSQTQDNVQEDDFDVDAELQKPVFSKAGDIWKLGRHKLICGDSTKPETFEQLLLDQKVNLVVTDPPYAVDYKSKAGKIKNDAMKEEEFYTFLLSAFKNMHEFMAGDSSIYVFHSDLHGLTFRKAFFDAGFYLSECCIWKKDRFVLGRAAYQWQHEPCLFGWKQTGKHSWYGDRKQSTIWEFDRPSRSKEHPTMKPIELMAYPIMNSTLTNSLVLDPFGGSGSTLIACEQTNRICFMVELDEKFCDVIINRFIEQVGSSANVTCIRDGLTYSYNEISPEVSQN